MIYRGSFPEPSFYFEFCADFVEKQLGNLGPNMCQSFVFTSLLLCMHVLYDALR